MTVRYIERNGVPIIPRIILDAIISAPGVEIDIPEVEKIGNLVFSYAVERGRVVRISVFSSLKDSLNFCTSEESPSASILPFVDEGV